jgi:hypothetical protein
MVPRQGRLQLAEDMVLAVYLPHQKSLQVLVSYMEMQIRRNPELLGTVLPLVVDSIGPSLAQSEKGSLLILIEYNQIVIVGA